MNALRVAAVAVLAGAPIVGGFAPLATAAEVTGQVTAVVVAESAAPPVCYERTRRCGYRNGYAQGLEDGREACGKKARNRSWSATDEYWQGFSDGYDKAYSRVCPEKGDDGSW